MPTKIRQVAISVAIVMPEMGFDDEPIMPTMRQATVTKKNPKTTISSAEQQLAADAGAGHERQHRHHQHQAQRADQHDRDRQVALGARRLAAPPRRAAQRGEALPERRRRWWAAS